MIGNETELVLLLKKGDVSSFEKIFHAYNRRVYSFIFQIVRNQEESRNLAQETFIALWENRNKLSETTVFGCYLYRIARNLSLKYLRKKINEETFSEFISREGQFSENTTQQHIQTEELNHLIEKSIQQLPDRRKEIFIMSFQKGLSYKEIAEALKITENTVDSQIRNALNELRDFLKQNNYHICLIFIILSNFL